MDVKVELKDIINGNFKYYLNDKYKKEIFDKLKEIYKDWRIVAKAVETDTRNLFGIRRSFEYYNKTKQVHFISPKYLLNIKKLLNLKMENIENNIEMIKLGSGGIKGLISLPFTININKEPIFSIKRALVEYVISKKMENDIDSTKLPDYMKIKNYIEYDVELYLQNLLEEKIRILKKQGLKPKLKDFYVFEYRNPGTNNRVSSILPKKIIFSEVFSKEFGKWIGDRCGGPNKVGVANKNRVFISNFSNFLSKILKQHKDHINIELSCRQGFEVTSELKEDVNKIRHTKSQYGDFAYRVEVSNKFLRNFVFDILEKNIFSILNNSKSSVRYAFYAGLFEAEGCIESDSISWAFGFNLSKIKDSLGLLIRVVSHLKLLKMDGFSSMISRKVGNTKKFKIIKYYIRICHNNFIREKDLFLFKDKILPFIKHEDKIRKFEEFMKAKQKIKLKEKKAKKALVDEKLIPEVNIGMVGH